MVATVTAREISHNDTNKSAKNLRFPENISKITDVFCKKVY
jgi:hypothetical protein